MLAQGCAGAAVPLVHGEQGDLAVVAGGVGPPGDVAGDQTAGLGDRDVLVVGRVAQGGDERVVVGVQGGEDEPVEHGSDGVLEEREEG
ncbi:hypothetical protein P1P68_34480 [Streptomyces scabiei]|nr:hypothetical protein [Streptomyces scabiei]MDW8809768.1 hypothetical protein [Streptomyces scabiei]